MIRVFVDTSIARFADSERTKWVGQKQTVRWGPTKSDIVVYQPQTEYPLEKLNSKEHEPTYADALLIPQIHELAKAGLITLCWHLETHIEYVHKRKLGDAPAPGIIDNIQRANCPIYYSRMLVSPFDNQDQQLKFLKSLKHPDYDKWKKLIAVQADTKNERNQLMDAWHLWSAEHNHCEYFLTMDYRLIKSVASRKHDSSLRLVAPTQFLDEFKILRRPAELELEAWEKITKKSS